MKRSVLPSAPAMLPPASGPKRSARGGMTLLELVLALALMVIIMGVVATMIHQFFRAVDVRRTSIEESQLARAVLARISADLRSAVAYNSSDFASVQQLGGIAELPEGELSEDDLPDDIGGEEVPEIPSGGGSGEIPTTGDTSTTDDQTQPEKDLSSSYVPPTVAGVYGTQFQLEVDVSVLPRIEDFQSAGVVMSGQPSDIPSEVKTVAYYLAAPGTADTTTVSATSPSNASSSTSAAPVTSSTGRGSGLIRRALDRSTTQWAVENGDATRLASSGEMLAAEVIALEFRYFDGTAWLMDWDTVACGGLPMAVEVCIAVASSRTTEEERASLATLSLADPSTLPAGISVFRQVVRIPSAVPTADAGPIEVDAP